MSAFGDYDAGIARYRRKQTNRWRPAPPLTAEQRAERQRQEEETTVTTKDGKKVKLPKAVVSMNKGIKEEAEIIRSVREQLHESEEVLLDLEQRQSRRNARDEARRAKAERRAQRSVG